MSFPEALATAVTLSLAACGPTDTRGPRLRPIANALVENLYQADRNEEGTALLGLHVGQFRLQDRCLLLDYDGSLYTPVFVDDQDNVTLSSASVSIAGFNAEYGKSYYLPGLMLRDLKTPRADNCEVKTAFITEIADISDF